MPVELARERQAEDDAVLRAGEPIEFTQRIPIPNHDSREWLSVKYPVVDAEGKRYAGGFAFDVTERAEAEAALRQALEAAEAASRLKSQFLSTMSHELRTPLTAITGYAELLRMDGSLGPEHTADIEQITTSANHLLALVDDVLHLAQIEAGKTTIEPREVDLAAAVDQALAEVALRAAAKGLALDADVPPGPAVLADPLRLHQVLVNLVDNAVKFTDRGSVRVEARPVADGVEIAVADTGIGIAAEAAPHIFAAFQQADGSTSRRYGGAGLGLAIAKQLVDLHGGEIAVASRPGEGSTFTVRLPAAPATAGSGRAVAAMSA
jgi:signal transduction histidine kinase